ncbi:MAG: type IV secretory system conjugative DNA transfer family protein [Anaerolineae bacterium]|nr:type IV secretory system conjugative DNA transfer family protein [Anaerolineae bacterium]
MQDVLQWSIPSHRERDVVLIDFANTNYPPPLNPLYEIADYTSVVNLVENLSELFGEERFESTSMGNWLYGAVLALRDVSGTTMRDILRMFTDARFREELIKNSDNLEVQELWTDHNNLTPSKQAQTAQPILNRLRSLFADPILYQSLCHPRSIDFEDALSQNKILLVSLAALPSPSIIKFVGSLFLSKVWGSPSSARRLNTYYVYIDEAHLMSSKWITRLVAEGRKYGLSLSLALQYLGQVSETASQPIMSNVGTVVAFQCSISHAIELAQLMKPQFNSEQLAELPRYLSAIKMQYKGRSQPAFHASIGSTSFSQLDGAETGQRIRESSIRLYTPTTAEEVKRSLNERYAKRM